MSAHERALLLFTLYVLFRRKSKNALIRVKERLDKNWNMVN